MKLFYLLLPLAFCGSAFALDPSCEVELVSSGRFSLKIQYDAPSSQVDPPELVKCSNFPGGILFVLPMNIIGQDGVRLSDKISIFNSRQKRAFRNRIINNRNRDATLAKKGDRLREFIGNGFHRQYQAGLIDAKAAQTNSMTANSAAAILDGN